MPRPRYRTDRVLTTTLLAATVALAGCAVGHADQPDPAGSDPRSGATDPARSPIPDPMRADDLSAFLSPHREAAITVRPPADLAEAVAWSTAVVVAEVVDVRHTRTLVGQTPRDMLGMLGVVLRPVETVRGHLPSGSGEVVMEVLAGGDPEEAVRTKRSSIPSGHAVWLLREQEVGGQWRAVSGVDPVGDTTYHLTHLECGVFVQGADEVVVGPWPPGGGTELRASWCIRGERFDTLAELVSHLRTLE